MEKYGILGEHLSHSYSPQIHKMFEIYDYGTYEVSPDKLDHFMKNNDLKGFNVTIPYKEAVIPYCRKLSARAESAGSVNTVYRLPDGGYFGDNTDIMGFKAVLNEASAVNAGKTLVLGSGGASKSVCYVLKQYGISFHVVSRTGDINYSNVYEQHSDAEMIVNTTPVGMYPENGKSPINLELFPKLNTVIDLIYNPHKTELVLQAEDLGIKHCGGLKMLVSQAIGSAKIWTESEPTISSEEVRQRLLDKQLNIVLIGMPGSGKTTIGKLLASEKKRRFIDLDVEIEKSYKKTVKEIFDKYGERYFRTLETKFLENFSKESGLVISTGGGAVLSEYNRKLMRQNSRIIMIDCPLEKLATDGRPLSEKFGVKKLWEERKDMYYSIADEIIGV